MIAIKPSTALKILAVIVLVAGVLVSLAAGRRVNRSTLEAQLGSRFLVNLPQQMNAGYTAEAFIVDPGKLAAFGLANLKRGDKIRLIKEPGESDFTIEVTHRISLTVDAKGALRRLGH